MNLLAVLTFATAIDACAPPKIIPYRPWPRDTVFFELGRGDGRGCVFIAGRYLPRPYVVSAAFAGTPDSAFLGVAFNRIIPPGLRALDHEVTPSQARSVAFLWNFYSSSARFRPIHSQAEILRAQPAIDSVGFETALDDTVLVLRWKADPQPWRFHPEPTGVVRIDSPYSLSMVYINRGFSTLFLVQHGRVTEFVSAGEIRGNHRPCPEGQ